MDQLSETSSEINESMNQKLFQELQSIVDRSKNLVTKTDFWKKVDQLVVAHKDQVEKEQTGDNQLAKQEIKPDKYKVVPGGKKRIEPVSKVGAKILAKVRIRKQAEKEYMKELSKARVARKKHKKRVFKMLADIKVRSEKFELNIFKKLINNKKINKKTKRKILKNLAKIRLIIEKYQRKTTKRIALNLMNRKFKKKMVNRMNKIQFDSQVTSKVSLTNNVPQNLEEQNFQISAGQQHSRLACCYDNNEMNRHLVVMEVSSEPESFEPAQYSMADRKLKQLELGHLIEKDLKRFRDQQVDSDASSELIIVPEYPGNLVVDPVIPEEHP